MSHFSVNVFTWVLGTILKCKNLSFWSKEIQKVTVMQWLKYQIEQKTFESTDPLPTTCHQCVALPKSCKQQMGIEWIRTAVASSMAMWPTTALTGPQVGAYTTCEVQLVKNQGPSYHGRISSQWDSWLVERRYQEAISGRVRHGDVCFQGSSKTTRGDHSSLTPWSPTLWRQEKQNPCISPPQSLYIYCCLICRWWSSIVMQNQDSTCLS